MRTSCRVGPLILIAAMSTTGMAMADETLNGGLLKLDRNGDGKISYEEWQAGKPAQFRNLDQDQDGFVTREEATAYYTRVVKPADPKTPTLRVTGLFRKDANGDGKISLEELVFSADLEFRARDKDSDGFITPEDERKR